MYIQSTFIHIKGIGAKTEQYLWKKNILTWDDYVNTIEKKNLFFSQNESLLNASYIAYKERNIDYFAEKLNDNELYRLAISFPNDILFLDIETTGLSHYYDCITVIGWSLNNKYKYYIQVFR